MTNKNTIEVWDANSNREDTKHGLPAFGRAHIKSTEVDMLVLADNLKTVLSQFHGVLDDQQPSKSGYYVDEIELSLGVTGSGSVALIGKVEAGAQASIKVKLKRDRPS